MSTGWGVNQFDRNQVFPADAVSIRWRDRVRPAGGYGPSRSRWSAPAAGSEATCAADQRRHGLKLGQELRDEFRRSRWWRLMTMAIRFRLVQIKFQERVTAELFDVLLWRCTIRCTRSRAGWGPLLEFGRWSFGAGCGGGGASRSPHQERAKQTEQRRSLLQGHDVGR